MTILQSHRLALRHLVMDDASFILRLLNSPDWLQHIGDRNVHTKSGAHQYILSIIDQYEANPLELSCVVKREENSSIGLCGILKRDFLPHPDVGYALLPEVYRQGYATEIVTATISEFFGLTDHPMVYAMVKQNNEASISLLEKLVFIPLISIKIHF